jgi:hypothetical protein
MNIKQVKQLIRKDGALLKRTIIKSTGLKLLKKLSAFSYQLSANPLFYIPFTDTTFPLRNNATADTVGHSLWRLTKMGTRMTIKPLEDLCLS